MSHKSKIGDLGEKAFEYECLQRGIELWAPLWSNQHDIDFIVRRGGDIKTVQVKSTSKAKADREAYGFRWTNCNFDILACHRAETHDWWIIENDGNLPKGGTWITYNGKWKTQLNNWTPLLTS